MTKYVCMWTFFRQKPWYAIILIQRRAVTTQLMVSVYSSKYAPRPCLSGALSFRSFEQFLVSLRSQLWTLSSRKKSQNFEWRWDFSKFHQWKKLSKIAFFCYFFTFFQVLKLKIIIRLLYVLDIKMSSVR